MGASRSRVAGLRPRLLAKGFLVMATLVVLGWGLRASGLDQALNTRWVDVAVRGHGLNGELLLLAAGSAFVAVGLPRQAVCFMAGYAFGFGRGFLLASLASVLGCVLCFFYARLLGRELVMHRFGARVKRIDDFLCGTPLLMTVLIRFLPVGSNLLTNLVAGVSSVRPWPFFAGSLIGYAPQTAVFALLGSGVAVDAGLRFWMSAGLFVASAALGGWLYRRLRHGRSLGTEIDDAVVPDEEKGGERDAK